MLTRFLSVLIIFCALFPQTALAQHKSPVLEAMEKDPNLPEATKRLLEKAGHKDTVEWLTKEQGIQDTMQVIEGEGAQDYIQDQINTNSSLKDSIGTLDWRGGAFEENLWNSYSKDNFNADFASFEKLDTYLPSTRGILIRALTSLSSKPGFIRNNEEFVITRVNTLIKLGFVKEAVTLYSASAPPLSSLSDRFHLTGTKSYLASNSFDMACLESDLIDKDPSFEEDEQNLYNLVQALCHVHLKQPFSAEFKAQAAKSSLPTVQEIITVAETNNGTVNPTPILNETYESVASFLLTLSEQGKLSVNVGKIMNAPLSKAVKVSLLSNQAIGSKFRADIFREAVRENLLSSKVIMGLFEAEKGFASRLGAGFFLNDDDEMPADQRLDSIKAQLIANKNIGSPLSEIYLRSAARIKPVDSLNGRALFVISYLYLNGDIDTAERWFSHIPEGQKPLEIKEYDVLEQKKQSFFIFPLYEWHQIMLKEYVAFDRSDAFAQPNLVTTLLQGETNPDGSLKRTDSNSDLFKSFDGETKKLVKRLEEASRKQDVAQMALISALLIEKERRNRTLASKDYLVLVNFVLHKIRESGLNDYALFLARDVLSDRIAGTYKN